MPCFNVILFWDVKLLLLALIFAISPTLIFCRSLTCLITKTNTGNHISLLICADQGNLVLTKSVMATKLLKCGMPICSRRNESHPKGFESMSNSCSMAASIPFLRLNTMEAIRFSLRSPNLAKKASTQVSAESCSSRSSMYGVPLLPHGPSLPSLRRQGDKRHTAPVCMAAAADAAGGDSSVEWVTNSFYTLLLVRRERFLYFMFCMLLYVVSFSNCSICMTRLYFRIAFMDCKSLILCLAVTNSCIRF